MAFVQFDGEPLAEPGCPDVPVTVAVAVTCAHCGAQFEVGICLTLFDHSDDAVWGRHAILLDALDFFLYPYAQAARKEI